MNNPLLSLQTPAEVGRSLAGRIKALRLERAWTRAALGARAGVAPDTLKRFETTGQVSLDRLLRLAHALGRLHEFDGLLQPPAARSIAELEQRAAPPARKRGRR